MRTHRDAQRGDARAQGRELALTILACRDEGRRRVRLRRLAHDGLERGHGRDDMPEERLAARDAEQEGGRVIDGIGLTPERYGLVASARIELLVTLLRDGPGLDARTLAGARNRGAAKRECQRHCEGESSVHPVLRW